METNQVNLKEIEIMAPAGSYDSLTAAIRAGADSIYFGIEGLNMRARSSNNFTIEDLHNIARICADCNVKSYLTVNTIIYDDDLSLMRQIIDAAKEAHLTAIIASDIAAMSYAHAIGVEVHLSTQLNITNLEAIRFFAQFADVVVLARELNLNQVNAIYEGIKDQQIKGPSGKLIKIEMFCHGALCMAVSGKCYLSLHKLDYSANRGSCTQVCRKKYRVIDLDDDQELEVDNQYIMSPKDLKTIHFMNKMIDAGIRVFKIEGRARGAEYVRNVVECYKEAATLHTQGTFSEAKIAEWDTKLSEVFNRGFWDGYYLGQKLGEWTSSYGSEATKTKLYVGKGIKYFSNLRVAEFLIETNSIAVGDEIIVTGPTTGAVYRTIEELRVDFQPVEEAVKGDLVSIQFDDKIRPSDKLFKLIPSKRQFQ